MNHVNLIGKLSSDPKIIQLENGKRIAQFTLTTKEQYLDETGNVKSKSQWHRISAWGKWVKVLEELCEKGMQVAVEGKLVTHFYSAQGAKKTQVEVEANDIIIL